MVMIVVLALGGRESLDILVRKSAPEEEAGEDEDDDEDGS